MFCRDHAVQLHRARKEFEDAGVRLAVIGMGTPAEAADFRRAQGVDLPLLVDPDRKSYAIAGAKLATLDEMIGPKVVARAVRRTLASRWKLGSISVHQGRIMGHASQLGGVLLIAPDGSVRYAHLSEDISDNPPVREVIAAARAIRPQVKGATRAPGE